MRSLTCRAAPCAVALLLAALAACSDVVHDPVPASVTLAPATHHLEVGDTVLLAATVRSETGVELAGHAVAWGTGNSAVATVSGGMVVAVGAGEAIIAAQAGPARGEARVVVATPAPVLASSVTLDVTSLMLPEGTSRQLVATVRDVNGQPITRPVAFTSSDTVVARVDAGGRVTAHTAGIAIVTASADGQQATAEFRVTGSYAYDLAWDQRTGFGNEPQLWRLALGAAVQQPALIMPFAGVWDVVPSPDGTRIAFTGTSGGNTSIFVANADGTDIREVTVSPLNEAQPTWSPDGTRIAFRRWQQTGTLDDVWVMNADGSGQVNLTADAGLAGVQHSPAWAPAGGATARIAYVHETVLEGYAVSSIWTMLPDGTDKRPLTATALRMDTEPAWSPDATRLAFVRTGGTASGDLWLVNATGGGEVQLMANDPAGAQRSPTWSPEGRFIAFASNHEIIGNGYSYQLYTVTPDGTSVVRRTSEFGDKERPSWMPRSVGARAR